MVTFCRLLRERDLLVTPSEVVDALRGARAIDLTDRDELRLALRTILTAQPRDLPVFDACFDEFWRSRELEGGDDHFMTRDSGGRGRGQQVPSATLSEAGERPEVTDTVSAPVSSPVEVLAERDFKSFRPDELDEIKRTIALVARRLATHASRRYRAGRGGQRIDPRRTFRRNIQYSGTILELHWRRRRIRKPRIVLICDVSRSMETYSTFLLQFIYALQHALGKVESFVFSTRLTRVSDYFKSTSIETALERMALEAPDWAGGTRIGDSLHAFNAYWAPRVVTQRTVVLILSDGLDSGHWSVLEREMADLERRATRVIWLNPLLGNDGYRAAARSMRVALGHVSLFATAHNLASLRELATSALLSG